MRAVLPNPKHDLRPGMFVTANLKGSVRPNAVVVPQLAVQQGSKGHLVYVVNQTGVAELRPVVVGDYYGDKNIVIADGLNAGERVVVDGALKVVPGQPVQIAQASSAPPAAASQPPPKSGEAMAQPEPKPGDATAQPAMKPNNTSAHAPPKSGEAATK